MLTPETSSTDSTQSVAPRGGQAGGGYFLHEPAHALTTDKIFLAAETSAAGLSAVEAARRIAEDGPNSTPTAPRPGMFSKIIAHLSDVLVLILLAAAALKAVIGDWVDFAIILVVAIVNVAVGLIQEGKAEKALDSIKGMLALTAEVNRDGQWQTIPADQLVVGDIARVRSGSRIPADMRLTKAVNLQADESVLTGESDAVAKQLGVVEPGAGTGDRVNMLHSGTLITSGSGTGVVTATGADTEIGRIQTLMSEVEEMETPLSRQLAQLGKFIAILVGVMAVVMILIGVFVHDFTFDETVSAAIGFAVAAIPEGLPALVTITLAMGVQHMARRNAITRKLTAVEALGSVTTICSDKTGTLTKNEMTARVVSTATQTYQVSGEGYEPVGELQRGHHAVNYTDTVGLTRLVVAGSACNDAQVVQEGDLWKLVGAPTEGAIKVMATKAGHDIETVRKAVLPFESSHKFMATLDFLPHDASTYIHAVGAPDRLLARATKQLDEAGNLVDINVGFWNAIIDHLGSQGLRVLAICGREVTGDPVAEQAHIGFNDVTSLVMYGLVGIVDPPRPEAVVAIAECQKAGIDVVMITGDHAGTATAIAHELGIVAKNKAGEYTCPTGKTKQPAVMTGADLDLLTPDQLREAVKSVRVFARTSPEHKLRIVEALQKNGHVTAMTGDGVNDAPALQKADVGVAMGIKGTEATKEAADVVLADDNFATIERAVEEGRRIFDNIRKSVVFLLPTNGAQSLVILVAVLFGWALPLTPAQILWANMITAVTLSLALAYEPAEPGLMDRKPRNSKEGVLTRGSLIHVLFVSMLIGGITIFVVRYEASIGSSTAVAQTVAITTLVLAQLAYLFNCRFLHRSSFTLDVFRGNKMIWISAGALIVLHLAFTLVPFINNWFGSTPISLGAWLRSIGLAVVVFVVVELGKYAQRSRGRFSVH